MMHIIPNFLIRAKIAKWQIQENFHKNVNENILSFTFLYKLSWVSWREIKAAKLNTANFNLFKLFFYTVSIFPNFDGLKVFSQIQQLLVLSSKW